PQLARLYVRDRSKALEILALGRQEAGIRRLPIRLAVDKREGAIGRLDLGLSTAAINADLRRSLNRDAAALLASLLFGVLGAFWIARRIAQPLTDLSMAMDRLREGDFEVRLPMGTQTNDEVGALARSFDEMAQGLLARQRLRGIDAVVWGAVELPGHQALPAVLPVPASRDPTLPQIATGMLAREDSTGHDGAARPHIHTLVGELANMGARVEPDGAAVEVV